MKTGDRMKTTTAPEALHYAVRKFASEILPTYDADDGPLSAGQMAAIRKAAGPASGGKVLSSLF